MTISDRPERHGNRWTDHELAVLHDMVISGIGWVDIGAQLQRKPEAVQKRAMQIAFEQFYGRPVNQSSVGDRPERPATTGNHQADGANTQPPVRRQLRTDGDNAPDTRTERAGRSVADSVLGGGRETGPPAERSRGRAVARPTTGLSLCHNGRPQ